MELEQTQSGTTKKQEEMRSNLLVKHTMVFSAFALLAQIFGLIRDLYLVKIFGVGELLDIYYMAFKVPDYLNVFYSVFLGSVVFIPLLTAAKLKGDLNFNGGNNILEIKKKINEIGSLVLILVTIVSLLLFILMPSIVSILVPTWDQTQINLLIELSRILLVAQVFFPIGILAGSLGMIFNRPFFMAISGFIYNIIILLGTILLVPIFGIYGVIYSVVLGAVVFALVQLIPKEVNGILKDFVISFQLKEWIIFIKKNVSRFFAVLVYQSFGILLLYIASFSGPGGISVFSISYNIFLALFFILGGSLSTVAMPKIAELHLSDSEDARELQRDNLNNSLIYMFFIGVFIAFFGFIFSYDIIKILYFFSNITFEQKVLIGSVLGSLFLSLPFFNLLEIIRKYLYSTNQISFAGFLTVILIFLVIVISVFLNKSLDFGILNSLTTALFFSNLATLLFALAFLNSRKYINLEIILQNLYKVILITFSSLVGYILLQIYITKSISTYLQNYFLVLGFKGLALLIMFIIFTYIFNDKIGKNILKQIVFFIK